MHQTDYKLVNEISKVSEKKEKVNCAKDEKKEQLMHPPILKRQKIDFADKIPKNLIVANPFETVRYQPIHKMHQSK